MKNNLKEIKCENLIIDTKSLDPIYLKIMFFLRFNSMALIELLLQNNINCMFGEAKINMENIFIIMILIKNVYSIKEA